MRGNVADLVWNGAEDHSENIFTSNSDVKYLYSEAKQCILHCAAELNRHDVRYGDRVIIIGTNSPEILFLMFATHFVGAIAVILHESTTIETLESTADELDPKLIVLDKTCAAEKNVFSRDIVILEELMAAPENISSSYNQPVRTKESDLALIIYTSGSTGKPRGVCLSHENILFVVEKIQQCLQYQSNDIVGLFLPLSFDYGLYQAFLCAQAGAHLMIRDASYAGPMLLSVLAREKITVLPGVPNLLSGLLKLAARRQLTLPAIRIVTNTGAHLPASYLDELKNITPNVDVFPMYGLTECKRVSILTPAEMMDAQTNSVGRALSGTQAWVVDKDGQALPAGEVGELVVKGPHVGKGYWKAPAETALRYRNDPADGLPVLYTGDQFTMDEAGFLYYVGRMDEQIKHKGFRINKLEIETAALNIPGVLVAAVIHVGETLTLFLAASEAELEENKVLVTLSEKLEPYKVPDAVVAIKEMPRTQNGKIDSHLLAKMV